MLRTIEYREPYGYPVPDGYLGWVKRIGDFMLFSTEGDYLDYIESGE